CQVPAGAAPGEYLNTTSAVTCDQGTGNDASSKLFVAAAPTFTKTYLTNPVAPGNTVELEFTITNTDLVNELTDIAFTDEFATIITTASVVPADGECGAGSNFTFTPLIPAPPLGSTTPARLTLSGGSIPAGGSCTFSITLDIPA